MTPGRRSVPRFEEILAKRVGFINLQPLPCFGSDEVGLRWTFYHSDTDIERLLAPRLGEIARVTDSRMTYRTNSNVGRIRIDEPTAPFLQDHERGTYILHPAAVFWKLLRSDTARPC